MITDIISDIIFNKGYTGNIIIKRQIIIYWQSTHGNKIRKTRIDHQKVYMDTKRPKKLAK